MALRYTLGGSPSIVRRHGGGRKIFSGIVVYGLAVHTWRLSKHCQEAWRRQKDIQWYCGVWPCGTHLEALQALSGGMAEAERYSVVLWCMALRYTLGGSPSIVRRHGG